jgi:predicted phage terminase large subunit-like protein
VSQAQAQSDVSITPAQAAAEVLRRERARASLVEYARAIDIPGAPASDDPDNEIFKPVESSVALHHRVIMEAIQRCIMKYKTTGKPGRLIIMAPPGSAKSSYASVVAPPWCMGKFPGTRYIIASYASKLAESHSRKARALCRDPRVSNIWKEKPTRSKAMDAVADWGLSNGSEFIARGFQGGITGNRADGIIIDDPVAGREEADSENNRLKIKDGYREDVLTRIKPGAWIILIQTRWHEDDLAGSLLPEDYQGESGTMIGRDNQEWEVLNIPAKCERDDDPVMRQPGEYLWPEWFPESHWHIWENDPQSQRTWASLYQQRPTAADGIEFKREWFKWYDPDLPPGSPGALPEHLNKYGASDYATKNDRKADFTEHGVIGVDEAMNFWFIDWWYKQTTSDIYIAYWIAMLRRHQNIRRWWDEGGPIGNAIQPAKISAMRLAKRYVTIEKLPSIKSKAIKLASFQAKAAAGMVYFPLKRPWASRLVDQLCSFPTGRFDDGADVCGLLGRGVDKMAAAHVPSADRKPDLIPYSAQWLEYEETANASVRFN